MSGWSKIQGRRWRWRGRARLPVHLSTTGSLHWRVLESDWEWTEHSAMGCTPISNYGNVLAFNIFGLKKKRFSGTGLTCTEERACITQALFVGFPSSFWTVEHQNYYWILRNWKLQLNQKTLFLSSLSHSLVFCFLTLLWPLLIDPPKQYYLKAAEWKQTH